METGRPMFTIICRRMPCAVISTETLGMAFEPEQKYENPDGTPIVFRYDYFRKPSGHSSAAGPVCIKRGCGRSIKHKEIL